METRTTRRRAHRAQDRAQQRAKERSAKAKALKVAAAAKKVAARAAAKAAKAAKEAGEPEQLVLFDNREAKKRRFASGKKVGRPPKPGAGQRHENRPQLNPRYPLHVTTRLCEGLPSLRTNEAFDVILGVFRETREKRPIRIIHFSIQSNHLHLIVEVEGRTKTKFGRMGEGWIPRDSELAKNNLARGLQGMFVSLAKRLHKLWGTEGTVFEERYHAGELSCPLMMKNAIQYVLHNGHKHGSCREQIDPFSSGPYFDGWEEEIEAPEEPREEWPVEAPGTWLARVGWTRHGPIPFPVAA